MRRRQPRLLTVPAPRRQGRLLTVPAPRRQGRLSTVPARRRGRPPGPLVQAAVSQERVGRRRWGPGEHGQPSRRGPRRETRPLRCSDAPEASQATRPRPGQAMPRRPGPATGPRPGQATEPRPGQATEPRPGLATGPRPTHGRGSRPGIPRISPPVCGTAGAWRKSCAATGRRVHARRPRRWRPLTASPTCRS